MRFKGSDPALFRSSRDFGAMRMTKSAGQWSISVRNSITPIAPGNLAGRRRYLSRTGRCLAVDSGLCRSVLAIRQISAQPARCHFSPLRTFERWGAPGELELIQIRQTPVLDVILSEFPRRHLPCSSELAIEVRQIGKAGVRGDDADRPIGFHQPHTSPPDPQPAQVVRHILTQVIPERLDVQGRRGRREQLSLFRVRRVARRAPKWRSAALSGERPLRGDEGVEVLVDIGRTPRLAALGELDRPASPMSRLRGLIGGELKPRGFDRPVIGGVLERSPANNRPRSARWQASRLLHPTQRRLARFAAGGDRAIASESVHNKTSLSTADGIESLTICCRIQFLTGAVRKLNQNLRISGNRNSQGGIMSSTTSIDVRDDLKRSKRDTSRRSMIR